MIFSEEFDKTLFFSDVNYLFLPAGDVGKWLYLIAGIGLPLLLEGFILQIKKRIKRTKR